MNGVRRRLGLPALSHADDLFRRPPLLVYLTS
jgi:hypothetical protein